MSVKRTTRPRRPIERSQPTHTLVIEVPLKLDAPAPDFDPVQDALRLALSISRLACEGHVCDVTTVSLREETR